MIAANSRELVTVATYWDPMEAQIARLRLVHEGIPAFLEKECTVQMVWHITNAIGGVRLVVPLSQSGEARRLLDQKELFNDWRLSRCWELSIKGNAVVTEEEGLAAARDLEFKEPLAAREELAEKALRAAVLGLKWEIAFLFACGHLLRFHLTSGKCRPAYLAKARWAWRITAIMAACIVLFIIFIWLRFSLPFGHSATDVNPPLNALRP